MEPAGAMSDEPGSQDAAPALSVAGAARGLGVAPATLRSWERRYGLAPSLHTRGGHRRYGPADLARLQVMHRLVREGVPPAEAARVAIQTRVDGGEADPDTPYAAVLGAGAAAPADERADASSEDSGEASSAGGGRVLAMPRGTRSARGLARAAMALDAHSCHRALSAALADRGALFTWDELIRPVMAAIGDRWAQTGRGVEVEHSFSAVVAGALSAHAAHLARARNDRPVLLASVPGELHDLPLLALQAALADVGIRSHLTGARTPDEALADAVIRLGPPVVFLWSQMGAGSAPRLPAMRPAPQLIVGGPGWSQGAEQAHRALGLADAVGAIRAAMGL